MNSENESIMTLKKHLGLDESQAKALLRTPISINAQGEFESSLNLRDFLIEMLGKTFSHVQLNSVNEDIGVEIIVGNQQSLSPCKNKIYLQWSDSTFHISTEPLLGFKSEALHSVLLRLGAAYVCGAVICHSLPTKRLGLGERYPIILKFKEMFGEDLSFLDSPSDLGILNVVGIGATGTWFLDAVELMNTSGSLITFDDDVVSEGNLQRTTFGKAQVGLNKVLAHQQSFLPYNDKLKVIPKARRFTSSEGLSEKIVSCIDSRGARRKIQDCAPRKTYDCSTTDISEVTIFFGDLHEEKPCLSCLYSEQSSEKGRLQDIASSLGVEYEEVLFERITPAAALKIKVKYPELNVKEIVGLAYDTFVKELCGQGKLQASNSDKLLEDTLAPLCHVSAIAGIILAIETTRRHSQVSAEAKWNYWKVNPWTSPIKSLQANLPVNDECAFHRWSLDPALAIWNKHDNLESSAICELEPLKITFKESQSKIEL